MRKGATTFTVNFSRLTLIVALRNEKGSYNAGKARYEGYLIVALRNEKGSYNLKAFDMLRQTIVALRNEKGSYN